MKKALLESMIVVANNLVRARFLQCNLYHINLLVRALALERVDSSMKSGRRESAST